MARVRPAKANVWRCRGAPEQRVGVTVPGRRGFTSVPGTGVDRYRSAFGRASD